MKRIYDKRPYEHRKRTHYNSKGIAKLSFNNEREASRYIKKVGLLGYSAYLCPECNHWHVGRHTK